ncbi:hypothetical protein N802_05085 [Knoellia sinensis KCTC 19936]|uniref:DUF305 domain-containing protein n=1 Tax=Knoellia sinensis KCTC 19936 TaxID=1385520 RepID=A0A0A0J2S2_9MICO|nr:DUF305 domain-containing protein [Knoellia sinensis]KGN30979.1 hypothetical protein N802_05085 [Knoellia sinensis KCTC 19936]
MLLHRRVTVTLLAAALTVGLSGCSGDDNVAVPERTGAAPSGSVIQPGLPGEPNATLTGSAAMPSHTATVAPTDVAFYQDMIVHHSQAIVMVETAMPRLSDTQVKALASRMADEQKPEIMAMKTWLEERKQEVPPQATNPRLGDHDHADMPGMATPAQLAELGRASGVVADRMFLTLMTKHHQGAIDMVREHGKHAGEEIVGEMAADMNVTQTKQIDQMQSMLARLA